MKENTKKGVTRREFLGLSALGLASLTILPSWAVNGVRIAPSDRVVLGFVGLGQQGLSDFKSFSTCPGVQVAACCDVDSLKNKQKQKKYEPARGRTWNLLIRSQTRFHCATSPFRIIEFLNYCIDLLVILFSCVVCDMTCSVEMHQTCMTVALQMYHTESYSILSLRSMIDCILWLFIFVFNEMNCFLEDNTNMIGFH